MASFFAPLPIIINANSSGGGGEDMAIDDREAMIVDKSLDMPAILGNEKISMSAGAAKEPEVWHVARYGRIYKRKAPSKVGYAHIPCPPGHRYCKFYANVKRYICRHHHYLRVNKRFRERVLTSDFEKMAEIAWLDLFRVCPILGYAKADYDRHDIKDLVINTKIPLSVSPRAVPIDPSIPMRPRNVAIVSSANMSLLLKIYVMTCSRAQYILLVQSVNLLPTNADAGTPWDPFHNPNYVRQDMDVKPILDLENSRPKELPHVEAVWEMMKEDQENLDACKNRLGRAAGSQDQIMADATTVPEKKSKKDKRSLSSRKKVEEEEGGEEGDDELDPE
jgi:hypothetical protein